MGILNKQWTKGTLTYSSYAFLTTLWELLKTENTRQKDSSKGAFKGTNLADVQFSHILSQPKEKKEKYYQKRKEEKKKEKEVVEVRKSERQIQPQQHQMTKTSSNKQNFKKGKNTKDQVAWTVGSTFKTKTDRDEDSHEL